MRWGKGSETPLFLMLRPRERGSLRPFSPPQEGVSDPFSHRKRENPVHPQIPLATIPFAQRMKEARGPVLVPLPLLLATHSSRPVTSQITVCDSLPSKQERSIHGLSPTCCQSANLKSRFVLSHQSQITVCPLVQSSNHGLSENACCGRCGRGAQ